MQINLSLRRSGGLLVYGIPLWYRATSAVVALVIVAASAFSGGLGIAGTVIAIAAILAALYQERWTFNAASGECSGRIGLVFASRGPSFRTGDVARLRVDIFAKGRLDQRSIPDEEKLPTGSQARLIVDLKDGSSLMVDSVPFRRKAELVASAIAIAESIGAPLES